MRLLDGPNLYFPRPAAKVTLDCAGLVDLPVGPARQLADALGLGTTRPGPPGSVFRQRFAIRLLTRVVRRLARSGGVARLAVRCRPGSSATELVVAYPWRNSARAEVLAYGLGRVVDELPRRAPSRCWRRWPMRVRRSPPRRPARRRGCSDRPSRWSPSPAPTARRPPRG